MTTAVVAGATGLTGSALVSLLLQDARFTKVLALTRRSTGIKHAKFAEEIIDFDKPQSWEHHVRGDVAFSCLGTTKKDAGSLAAQRRVDVDYQRAFAEAASKQGVSTLVLLSSAGADAASSFPYLRMKGELDDVVGALAVPRVRIIRPASLVGDRERPRLAEHITIFVGRLVTAWGPARRYRPISATTVAQGMLASVFDGAEKRRVYALDEVFSLAESGGR